MMLEIERIHDDAIPPKRATTGDAGLDLTSVEDMVLQPEEVKLVPTGWKMAVPMGFEIQIRPRSGLALKNKIMVLNSPGTVDCHYRGEVKVILYNEGKEPFEIKVGDRIAQMVINKVELWEPELREKLSETDRGDGGMGSTGVCSEGSCPI